MSLGVLEWTESGVLEVALASLGTRSPSSAIATKSTTAVASQILKATDTNTQIHKYTNTLIHKYNFLPPWQPGPPSSQLILCWF